MKPEEFTKYNVIVKGKACEAWYIRGFYSSIKQVYKTSDVQIVSKIAHISNYRIDK